MYIIISHKHYTTVACSHAFLSRCFTLTSTHVLFCLALKKSYTFAGVMLPMKNLLIINEPCTLAIDNFFSKVFILQQIKKVQTHGVPTVNRKIKNIMHKRGIKMAYLRYLAYCGSFQYCKYFI